MVWFSINGQNIGLPLWHNRFSRCWAVFWSLVEHLLWVKGCPGGISHHSVPPQWAKMCVIMAWSTANGQNINWCSWQYWFSRFWRVLWSWYSTFRRWTGIPVEPVKTIHHCSGLRNCVFMVWSSNMARKLNCLHGETIFSRCWGVFWYLVEYLPQVERCSGLVSQHCVPLKLDQKVCIHGLIHYKWPEHWLSFMAKPVFQVLRSLLVFGRASSAGGKMFSPVSQYCVPL